MCVGSVVESEDVCVRRIVVSVGCVCGEDSRKERSMVLMSCILKVMNN